MIKHYKICIYDGTNIKVRNYNWYAGEPYLLVIKREDVVDDPWHYFSNRNTTKIYFVIYSLTRIEEEEVETGD